ncbi:gas vesicle protein [Streptantibioticus rubrisoli]|uniref:Gas vesicle protein n=1 Tax=Streptantibioticus rubrisoli TaxID=1387313 RepID=A0ABT1PG02_9ACTN|nr:gas vesicle protein [Streptantibioticus rubrisoli]MCQ4043726.1 gas vesicle protein [Streptantibioticus rubrisoli]
MTTTDHQHDNRQTHQRRPRENGTPLGVAMRAAASQLSELLQCQAIQVSAIKATEEGWSANVEVVEIERIPDTTSVMASYRVALDSDGELVSYERTHRYARGQLDR